MNFEPCERETTVSCSDEDRTWSVYTRQKVVMTKLEKANWECVKVWKDKDGVYAKEFRAPFDSLTFRNQNRKKHEYSQEEKDKIKARFANKKV